MDSKMAGRVLVIAGGLIVLCGFSATAWSSQDAEASPSEFPQATAPFAGPATPTPLPSEDVSSAADMEYMPDPSSTPLPFEGAFGSTMEGLSHEQDLPEQTPGFSSQ